MKKEQKEIDAQILEIKNSKENIQAELIANEELEKNIHEQIAQFQKELEVKRKEESQVAAQVTEWELKVERMLQKQMFHQSIQ
jgi:chromosome segregation protein